MCIEVHMCACACACTHVEITFNLQLCFSSEVIHLILWDRVSYSSWTLLIIEAVSSKPKRFSCFHLPAMGFQVHTTTQNFLSECWGSKQSFMFMWQVLQRESYLSSSYMIKDGNKTFHCNIGTLTYWLRVVMNHQPTWECKNVDVCRFLNCNFRK